MGPETRREELARAEQRRVSEAEEAPREGPRCVGCCLRPECDSWMETEGAAAGDSGKGHVQPGLGACRGQAGGRGGEGENPLADVLPGEDDAAGLAFEAADVPLLVQSQE